MKYASPWRPGFAGRDPSWPPVTCSIILNMGSHKSADNAICRRQVPGLPVYERYGKEIHTENSLLNPDLPSPFLSTLLHPRILITDGRIYSESDRLVFSFGSILWSRTIIGFVLRWPVKTASFFKQTKTTPTTIVNHDFQKAIQFNLQSLQLHVPRGKRKSQKTHRISPPSESPSSSLFITQTGTPTPLVNRVVNLFKYINQCQKCIFLKLVLNVSRLPDESKGQRTPSNWFIPKINQLLTTMQNRPWPISP